MRLQRIPRPRGSRREPTIALINIVFLMLVFFLLAGTIAAPVDNDVALVRVAELDPMQPQDALVIHADGRLQHQGRALDSVEAYLSGLDQAALREVRIVPDRDLPATRLIEIGASLRAGGAGAVIIVTERGLP